MDQLNILLPDDSTTAITNRYYNEILDILKQSKLGYDLSQITVEHRTPELGDAYDTLLMFDRPCFHVKGKKTKHIYFHSTLAKLLTNSNIPYEPSSDSRWARVNATSFCGFSQIPNVVEELYEDFLRTSDGFGCCGSYIACSDAGYCIKTDIMFSGRCAYRQNLKAGRIFYGKNKNN